MKKLYLITDYKGFFGSKYFDVPYRSGMDRELLASFFKSKGYEVVFLKPLMEELERQNLREGVIVFASHQDPGLFYKNYLEDLAVSLELAGYRVCPSSYLIRAHENKVFFGMISYFMGVPSLNSIKSSWYGAHEDFTAMAEGLKYPVIIKSAEGSMSRKVFLATGTKEAKLKTRNLMRTPDFFLKVRDMIRQIRHKGYTRESWRRKKILVQEYVPGLKNDYKVLVYGKKYYVIHRGINKDDFSASGQGLLSYRKDIPPAILDFAEECFAIFKAPQVSLDIGYDGESCFLFEAQYVCFGTYTIEKSPFYFIRGNGHWTCVEGNSCLEEEYARSIVEYIEQ